jgi:hypothetical protein
MFNLLVKAQSWGDGRDTMLASRAFEYTEKSLVDRFKPGGQLDLVALASHDICPRNIWRKPSCPCWRNHARKNEWTRHCA